MGGQTPIHSLPAGGYERVALATTVPNPAFAPPAVPNGVDVRDITRNIYTLPTDRVGNVWNARITFSSFGVVDPTITGLQLLSMHALAQCDGNAVQRFLTTLLSTDGGGAVYYHSANSTAMNAFDVKRCLWVPAPYEDPENLALVQTLPPPVIFARDSQFMIQIVFGSFVDDSFSSFRAYVAELRTRI